MLKLRLTRLGRKKVPFYRIAAMEALSKRDGKAVAYLGTFNPLAEEEKQVVANVVYYHYKGTPNDDDAYFNALTELQKIQVTKLVAIIRVACALDAGSNQKISDVTLEERDNVLYVFCRTNEDISLEWWTFNRDSEYFTEVFGMEIVLVRGGDCHVQ